MSVRLAEHNISEQLALDGRAVRVAEAVKRLDADVVILPDAYWLDNPLHGATAKAVRESLGMLGVAGYGYEAVDYGTPKGQWPGRYLVALSRLPAHYSIVEAGSRQAAKLRVTDPDTNTALVVFGVHLSDISEEERTEQALRLREHFSDVPIAVAGDLNSMPAGSWTARVLRSRPVRQLAERVRDPAPRNYYERSTGRANKLKRLAAMAEGRALAALVEAGLRDADPRCRPTIVARGLGLAQLDHIMVSQDVRVKDFRLHPRAGSDHRAISAELEF